jgi:hypothetical protein
MAFPSTFKSLQDEVIGELRLEEADRSVVKDWINVAYAQAAIECEALQVDATVPLSADVESYTLNDPVVRIKWITARGANQTGFGRPLKLVSHERLLELRSEAQYGLTTTGTVQCYTLAGDDRIEVWPTPQSSSDMLLMVYVKLPTALSADGDVPVFNEPYNSRLLKYGALIEAAPFQKDVAVNDYRALYEDWLRRFRLHLNRRSGSGTDQFEIPLGYRFSIPNDADVA